MTAPGMKFILCSLPPLRGSSLGTSSWNKFLNSSKRDQNTRDKDKLLMLETKYPSLYTSTK